MKETDAITRQRLNSLRTKLPANTALSLDSVSKQLLKSGFTLPANGDQVSHFLLEKAESGLKISSLRNYASMIIKWHTLAGYQDLAQDIKNKAIPVVKGLRQERIESGQREFRNSATPLLLEDALKIDSHLLSAFEQSTPEQRGIAMQDLALFRLLWWSGCRESEVATLKRWQVTFSKSPRGIGLRWSDTKTSKSESGVERFVPALPSADPMVLFDWLDLYAPNAIPDAPRDMQPVFVRQLRDGSWRDKNIHPNSIPAWIRRIASEAGVPYANNLSGHSCRQGLAKLMSDSVSLREVMDYFKWKRADTAIGYTTRKGVSENVISVLELVCQKSPPASVSIAKNAIGNNQTNPE